MQGHVGAHGPELKAKEGTRVQLTVPVLLMVANVCVSLLQSSHAVGRKSSVFTEWDSVSLDRQRGCRGAEGESVYVVSCLGPRKCLTLFERFSLPLEHMESPMPPGKLQRMRIRAARTDPHLSRDRRSRGRLSTPGHDIIPVPLRVPLQQPGIALPVRSISLDPEHIS